jgi:hypothetical protein
MRNSKNASGKSKIGRCRWPCGLRLVSTVHCLLGLRVWIQQGAWIWYDIIWYDMIYDMIWYMMIWYGMVWYDTIYDMICYDMIYDDTTHDTRHTTHDTRHTTHDTRHTTHDTTRHDMTWYDIWYDTIRYDTMWCDVMWCDVMWHMIWMSVANNVCFQVEVSATGWSLVPRSPTECCVLECDLKHSTMVPPSPYRSATPHIKGTNDTVLN